MELDDIHKVKLKNCIIMDFVKKQRKPIFIFLFIFVFVLLLSISSCTTAFKEIANDAFVDSIVDPKTGTPIFKRAYDTEPYQINVVEVIKSRKAQKKKKKKEIIENYVNYDNLGPSGTKN